MSAGSDRPGGWVEGIGWVARLRDVDDADLIVWPDIDAPILAAEVRHLEGPNTVVVVEEWGTWRGSERSFQIPTAPEGGGA